MSQADVPVSVTWPTLHPTQSDWLVEPKAVGGGLIVARTLVSGEALNSAIRVINVLIKSTPFVVMKSWEKPVKRL